MSATATDAKPAYWDAARAHLIQRDRVMRRLVPQCGEVHLVSRGDAFGTLARSVVGQQISVKAAQSVWDRVAAQLREITPQALLKQAAADLRACGLSARKVEYLRDLAQHFVDDKVQIKAWRDMEDESIVQRLIAIRGIGRWTAEMFLMFHLLRPDVLPLDDLGLVNGVSRLYFSNEKVTRSELRELAHAWAPYRSVATWYIWRSLDPQPVAY